MHYRGEGKKPKEVVLSIADAIHQIQNTAVNIFIYQITKAVLCVLVHLLKSVCNRDKVSGGLHKWPFRIILHTPAHLFVCFACATTWWFVPLH